MHNVRFKVFKQVYLYNCVVFLYVHVLGSILKFCILIILLMSTRREKWEGRTRNFMWKQRISGVLELALVRKDQARYGFLFTSEIKQCFE